MNTSYKHTQFGTVMVASLLCAAIAVAASAVRSGWTIGTRLVEIFVLGCALVFCCLTTEIKGGELVCRFGPGLIRKRFLLSEIQDVRAVKNPWYYGWGIRITPQGRLFNVSGLHAVEIVLKNGRKYRIGTDQPEKLSQALLSEIAVDGQELTSYNEIDA
jgi:hypothetical protein